MCFRCFINHANKRGSSVYDCFAGNKTVFNSIVLLAHNAWKEFNIFNAYSLTKIPKFHLSQGFSNISCIHKTFHQYLIYAFYYIWKLIEWMNISFLKRKINHFILKNVFPLNFDMAFVLHCHAFFEYKNAGRKRWEYIIESFREKTRNNSF